MQENSSQALLQQAYQLFFSGKHTDAKEVIEKIEEKYPGLEMNKVILNFESQNRDNSAETLKSLLNMLTQINISLYENNRPKNINFISHEKLYLNIIAASKYVGNGNVTDLIGLEALFFSKSMRTNTVLPILYESLRRHLMQNRLHTSLEILQKFQQVINHARSLNIEQEKFKLMMQGLYIRTLLKLELLEESQGIYMLNFGETEREKFEETKKKSKNKLNFETVANLVRAEIEFYSRKFDNSINLLSQVILNSEGNKGKIYAENNLGIILSLKNKGVTSQKILTSSSENIYKLFTNTKKSIPEIRELYWRSKQNIFLAQINSRDLNTSSTHYKLDIDQKTYNHMKHVEQIYSYKHQYRRGQCCLNLYHSSLEKIQRKLPWQEVHENYDNVYYHPNVPYYQFKGKNRNVHLANKKPVYRRYILNEWNHNPDEEQVDKDLNRRKFQKQAGLIKLKSLLAKAEEAFKKSLLILEKEESILLNLESMDKDMAKKINQKLFYQIAKYRSSILCLLTYTSLCQCKWAQTVSYAEVYSKRKCYEISHDDYFFVLTYQMEAYCELNRIDYAYDVVAKLMRQKLTNKSSFHCRDSSNLANCAFQYNQNQQLNFLYNFAVLNSRDSRIPESHQSIQKLYTQMNINKYPRADMPFSMIELLTYYNLRTKNVPDALEVIKRRGIIGGAMASMNKPILNITK